MNIAPMMLTEAETAEELRISLSSLRNLRRAGRIGYIQILKRIYHTPAQIMAFINSQTVDACPHQTTQESPAFSKTAGLSKSQDGNRGSGIGHGTTDPAAKSAVIRQARGTFRRPAGPLPSGSSGINGRRSRDETS